jgi:NitT/TauT family transport system permease protein
MADVVPVVNAQAMAESLARRQRWATIIAVHVAAVVLWEVIVRATKVPAFVLPPPSAVIATLTKANYAWTSNTLVTAAEIFGGYLLAVGVGVAAALVLSWSKRLMLLLFPLLVTLNMIPKIALGPLIIVWFSYGIGPTC